MGGKIRCPSSSACWLAESNRQFRRREEKEQSEQQVRLLRAMVWDGVGLGEFLADTDYEFININLYCELMTLILNNTM